MLIGFKLIYYFGRYLRITFYISFSFGSLISFEVICRAGEQRLSDAKIYIRIWVFMKPHCYYDPFAAL
jgi:hypothetical protein